jgi:hypothetical protein
VNLAGHKNNTPLKKNTVCRMLMEVGLGLKALVFFFSNKTYFYERPKSLLLVIEPVVFVHLNS